MMRNARRSREILGIICDTYIADADLTGSDLVYFGGGSIGWGYGIMRMIIDDVKASV
ncbi:MAG: hypothetical protein Q4D77_00250 [Peptostreptococcaceae bacterium]|nr:hypothetical protein [Peptostreptococcaceae bacterium]